MHCASTTTPLRSYYDHHVLTTLLLRPLRFHYDLTTLLLRSYHAVKDLSTILLRSCRSYYALTTITPTSLYNEFHIHLYQLEICLSEFFFILFINYQLIFFFIFIKANFNKNNISPLFSTKNKPEMLCSMSAFVLNTRIICNIRTRNIERSKSVVGSWYDRSRSVERS